MVARNHIRKWLIELEVDAETPEAADALIDIAYDAIKTSIEVLVESATEPDSGEDDKSLVDHFGDFAIYSTVKSEVIDGYQ